MPPVSTDAVVLHAFDYLESSRIFRLATRDAGVRSVLARGARRSARRFGSALDLFAQGTAELHTKPGRDLDTLAGFDVVRARPALAASVSRFAGAATIAELTLRFAPDDADPALFDAVVAALDAVGDAPLHDARAATLAGAWRIIAELGFAPSLDRCSECGGELPQGLPVTFSHPAGGALCERCSRLAARARLLPDEARTMLSTWIAGDPFALPDDAMLRAHQRLLREFLHEHLTDGRALRAFESWERDGVTATAGTAGA